jgi:aminopeptidase-like protein
VSIKNIYNLAKFKLFPLNRSLTGSGTRKTLSIIKDEIKELKIKTASCGKKVFDWKIPPEWNVKEAYVLDKYNKKIIDFKNNNLHLMSYSMPVSKILSRDKLLSKIHSMESLPNAIPYVTSFYKKDWAFCISSNQKKDILRKYDQKDKFKVIIKSSFKERGKLHYGEVILKGREKEEIIVSTYICHPSMANNELSGPIVSMCLVNFFKKIKIEKTIRFIFIPETIGSITYLSKNLNYLKNVVCGGYNLSCIGDERNYSCMLSKFQDSAADESLLEAFKVLKLKYKKHSFLKRGSDERQYNSPGIDFPVASIFRTRYGDFPEYHSSLDNFNLVTLNGIKGGYNVAKKAIQILQKKKIPKSLVLCEPQLGKRGLYPSVTKNKLDSFSRNIVNLLMYSDGRSSIEKISKKIKLNIKEANKIYKILKSNKLIK